MAELFSLSYFTCAPMTPMEQILLAKKLGYDAVGLRPVQPRPDSAVQAILGDKHAAREIARISRDMQVKILDIEFLMLDAAFDIERCKKVLELGAELGCEAFLVAGMDTDWGRMTQSYAKLCAFASEVGLNVDLEFMPWTRVSSLAAAARLIAEAGNPTNGKLLVDSIHFFRANTPIRELAALPQGLIHSVQLCDDVARPGISMAEARIVANTQRLAPGAGAFDLTGFLAALPPGTPIGLEIPNEQEIERHGAEGWSRLCLQHARRLQTN